MTRLMLRHALRFVSRVVWLASPQDLRSQRAVEKLGGVRVGSRPDAGGRVSHVYQLTESALTQTATGPVGNRRAMGPMSVDIPPCSLWSVGQPATNSPPT
jgi:hypothetical protein